MVEQCEGKAVIIGAGPAGLTAAYELATRTGLKPVVLEATERLGGLSCTVEYQGNRIDAGGHRFFSKSQRVMEWWARMLPFEKEASGATIRYQGGETTVKVPEMAAGERGMLVRPRRSRIYFLRQFFDYPLRLSGATMRKLGWGRLARIAAGYAGARFWPRRPEHSLEDFLVNRFGGPLYKMFFRDYTQKVWGRPCAEISAEWGAQRIKGLSIGRMVAHAAGRLLGRRSEGRATETSLIEQFLYPALGPGQLWEVCAKRISDAGGVIRCGMEVVRVRRAGQRVVSVVAREVSTRREFEFAGEVFFSTMPVRDLVAAMEPEAPPEVGAVAAGLPYRDFLTVGLLVRKLRVSEEGGPPGTLIRDNWIYIQEPGVKLGRLQVFNNWSLSMVARPDTVWLGLEYFCQEGDELWSLPDEELKALGARELAEIGLVDPADVLDGTVLRMPKAYPAYFGSYERFGTVREWTDGLENLFLIGRNGMHRYNNQDHSMLTAMTAVDQIMARRVEKAALWAVNAEEVYGEEG